MNQTITTQNIVTRVTLALAAKVERVASAARGKGFGSFSIQQEVKVALRALGRTPRLALDVGGNRGEYAAALAARAPKCEIVIFEPARTNVDALHQRFRGAAGIRIEPVGLSDQKQQAVLFADKAGSGAASLSKRNLAHFGVSFDLEERVRLVALDDFWATELGSRPIDIMKLDVEGHELKALQGARQALAATSVVQFEFGGCNIDSRTFFQDFFYMFDAAGFVLFRISPIGLERIDRYTEDAEAFRTTNFLAVRRR